MRVLQYQTQTNNRNTLEQVVDGEQSTFGGTFHIDFRFLKSFIPKFLGHAAQSRSSTWRNNQKQNKQEQATILTKANQGRE